MSVTYGQRRSSTILSSVWSKGRICCVEGWAMTREARVEDAEETTVVLSIHRCPGRFRPGTGKNGGGCANGLQQLPGERTMTALHRE